MSFSRAPLKRFNEHVACTPAPGTYEIKPGDPKGAASFDKSDRFKPLKSGAALQPPPSPSRGVPMSPVRRAVSVDGLVDASSVKKDKNGMTMERKQQKLLEKEIRSLVQQRGEQDKRLLTLEEELKKVEAKLLASVREKTGLAANVTTLERQRAELKKVNEFLKNKVSADTTKKRINSLTMELMEARNNLDVKNKELSVLKVNNDGQVKVLETDLQAVKNTVTALKERNKDLEELHQVTKTQNEELEGENAKLHAIIRELREEIKVVQEYLDAANDEIQDLRIQVQKKDKENLAAGSQVEELKQLRTELERCTTELASTQDALRQREEELESSQTSVSDLKEQLNSTNQKIQDSQTVVRQQEAELIRLREVLRRTEKELDERVAHLEQRCLFSEEERSKTQEEGLRRVEELKNELNSLKETQKEETERQIQLQQEHTTLTEELTKERALVDSLSVLVEHEREESEERLRQLKEEMEEVLGELAVMEEQEQGRQEVAEKRQEAFLKLQEENKELERQLSDTRAFLESESSDVVTLKNEHFAAMRELREAHTNSLSKMADIVTELESTKEALKGAKGRESELEAEVERVSLKMKEDTDKVVEQKEEIRRVQELLEEHQERQFAEAKAREENARMLLEVQTLLAQRDEEMKAAEASHTIQINQLQQELQLETKEKEEALGRLEEQTGHSATVLQNNWENTLKTLEEVNREKVEVTEQLQLERDDKGRLQSALQEEREAFEVERKEHQQVRSEVLTLQAELQRLEGERQTLLSQVKEKDQCRLALEHQLRTAEDDRNRLQEAEHQGASLQAQLDLTEKEAQTLREQVGVLTQEKVTLQWEMEEQRQELQRQITEAGEKSSPNSEMERWQKQFEELFAKVQPFQEQLNAFAAEKNALLNENGANQEELNKLADAYARLLGHQNQKQKIKHVMKLKDENISLKQEVSKLRSQVSRQKCDLEQLKSKLPGAPRRKFDPSKAFQHDKENRQAETAEPLKEGNHKL